MSTSILNALNSESLAHLTVAQLKSDLRLRNLSLVGNKNDLLLRIVNDNIERTDDGTIDELITLRMQSPNNNIVEDSEETCPDRQELLTQIDLLQKQVELLNSKNITQRFLQKYETQQSMTPPYSPQANSIVERTNGIIASTLRKIINGHPEKWDELLPNALLAINTTRQNSTKRSPFYLLHGYEPRLPRELHIASFIDDTPRDNQLDLLLARAEAVNNVYETHLDNKRKFDLHRRSHSFKAGDLVLYDWPKQGNHKLSPIFRGPFLIVRPVGAVCYEIRSMDPQAKLLKVVHVQHLRKYHTRDAPVIEEEESTEEEEDTAAEIPIDDTPTTDDQNNLTSGRYNLRRNRRQPI